METVRQSFDLHTDAEVTLEVNPNAVEEAYFAELRQSGVNRLSVGMQSAHEAELRLMARDHRADRLPRVINAIRSAGFDNFSLDLIFALPDQTLTAWQHSVQTAIELGPQHLSMYSLELEDGTPMTREVQRGRLPLPDEELAAEMYEAADHLAQRAGIYQYEISNWAKPGHECRHNLQYWRYGPYLGIGAGAHGFIDGIRYQNVRAIPHYIERSRHSVGANTPYPLTATVEHYEAISPAAAMLEYLFTGLRLVRDGVRYSDFAARFGVTLESVYGAALETLLGQGLLISEGDVLKIAPQARLISNRIFYALA
ncbi:MAG: radical SAM family heme chaperone HemW [Anaerolineae bacterium]